MISQYRQASILGLALILGGSTAALGDDKGKYTDDKFGFSMTVASSDWKDAPLDGFAVPGTIRAAWKGPGQSSIVAFVQEPGRAFSPRFLLDLSAKAMTDNLEVKVVAQEVKTVADKKAMWLVVEGKGTGGALTAQGDVATTQHWVAIPREKDIVVLLLTTPAADFEAGKKVFEAALKTLTVDGKQTSEQKEAK